MAPIDQLLTGYANKLLIISAVTLFSLPAVCISPCFVTGKVWGVENSVNKFLTIKPYYSSGWARRRGSSKEAVKTGKNLSETCCRMDEILSFVYFAQFILPLGR